MRISWMGLVLGLVACGNGTGEDTDTGGGTTVPDGALPFTDANNYSYTGEIDIGSVEVQSGADSTIDWCALTTDLRGRAVPDPSAVDQVLLVEFALSPEEIMEKVEKNDLKQSDTATQWLLLNPGACVVSMSDFAIIGNEFDPAAYMLENPDRTWLTSVMNTPDGRFDILMSSIVVPMDSSTNTAVVIDDSSSTLVFDADLASAAPLTALAGDTPWVDWSAVTVDVYGKDYDSLLGNRLLLGKVPVDSIEEAEELFLRLDEEAEALYYIDVYGQSSADLSQATTKDGVVFDGFTTDGIWLVGVECLTCTSPAPLILSVVEVVE